MASLPVSHGQVFPRRNIVWFDANCSLEFAQGVIMPTPRAIVHAQFVMRLRAIRSNLHSRLVLADSLGYVGTNAGREQERHRFGKGGRQPSWFESSGAATRLPIPSITTTHSILSSKGQYRLRGVARFALMAKPKDCNAPPDRGLPFRRRQLRLGGQVSAAASQGC